MALEDLLKLHATGHFNNLFKKADPNSGWAVAAVSLSENLERSHAGVGACHGFLRSSPAGWSPDYVVTRTNPVYAEQPGVVAFYDWLLNRSAFRDAFPYKDAKQSLLYGIIKTTHYHNAAWLGAAQLSRLTTNEYKNNMLTVGKAIEDGYDIHPLLLLWTFVAYNINLKNGPDSKLVYNSSPVRLHEYANCRYVFNGNVSNHLPGPSGLSTIEDLKLTFKDEPLQLPTGNNTFFQTRNWPSNSSSILLASRRNPGEPQTRTTQPMFATVLSETPTFVGEKSVVPVEKTPDASLWAAATAKLMKSIMQKSVGGGLSLDLRKLEAFSKTYNLGA